MTEKFYHVIGAVDDRKAKMLFSDLTLKDLISDFVRPYERGEKFFAGGRVVAPSELRLVRIVETAVPESDARGKINQDDLASIAEINRTLGFIIISPGRGYEPDDLVEAGTDVTRTYLRGGPGSSVGLLGLSKQAIGWTLGIVAAVIATGAAKWLGWS
jgi:hypothetical protein